MRSGVVGGLPGTVPGYPVGAAPAPRSSQQYGMPGYGMQSGSTTPQQAMYRPEQGRPATTSPRRGGAVPPLRSMPMPYPSGSQTPGSVNVHPSPSPQPMLAQPRSLTGLHQHQQNSRGSSYDDRANPNAPYVDVIPPLNSPMAPPPGHMPGRGALFEPNTLVEYFSSTFHKWIPAVVLAYSDVDGTYNLDVKQFAPPDRIRPRPNVEDSALEHTLLPLERLKPLAPEQPFFVQERKPIVAPVVPTPVMTAVMAVPKFPEQRSGDRACNACGATERQLEVMPQLEQELREMRRDNHELRTQLTYADASARRYQQELEESRAREEVLRERLRPRASPPLGHDGLNGGGSGTWNSPAARPLYDQPNIGERVKVGHGEAPQEGSWSFTWGGDPLME